jgi:ribosomal protein S18 acetylase RimI-like enzyme
MSESLQKASKADLAAAIETNLYTQLAMWQRPGVDVHDEPDVMWMRSGLPHPMFNFVLGARFPAGTVSAHIETVLAHFRPESTPFSWWIGPLSQPVNLDQKLEAHGLRHATTNAGMAADLQLLDEASTAPAGLAITRVYNRASLDSHLQVVVDAFRMPGYAHSFLGNIFAGLGLGPDVPLQHFVGHLRGRPVACASIFLDGRVAGIYTVGTVLQARRRGIGRAITLAALHHARQAGYCYGILHASAAGLNVYRGLGFKEYCPISVYVWSAEDGMET